MSLSWFFLPSAFNQCPFIFIFIHLLSVSCCIHSSAWWVSYLVENEQFVPWRFQLFGSLRDSSLEYQWGGKKWSQEKKRKYQGFFSNKVLFQGKGLLELSSLTTEKKQTKSKRLLKEICNFIHLHHFQDRFIAVLILPDMLEEKKKYWKEIVLLLHTGQMTMLFQKSMRKPAMSPFFVLVIFWWGT